MSIGEAANRAPEGTVDVAPPDPAPLAQQTLAYGLSGLIVPIVGMITLPIFARVFTRDQYGLVEIGTAMSAVALTLTDAGLTAAALRSFYDYKAHEEERRRSVLLTAFASSAVLTVVAAALLIVFRNQVAGWVFNRPGEGGLVVVIAVSIPALNAVRFASEIMRVRLQANHYLVTAVLTAVVTTALGVFGVLALGWRVKGVFVAALVGNTIGALYGFAVVRRGLFGAFSRPELRRMLVYGLPLVPSAISAWALSLVDRIILARLGSLAQVGEYAIANRLASLLMIGVTAFLLALSPFLFATYSEDAEQEKAARGRILTYLTFILSLAGLVLTLFAKELLEVVAPRFDDAYLAVGPLALGTAAYGIAVVLTTGIALARRTMYLAVLGVAAALVNIGLNFALIPPFGIVGSALATTVGFGVLALSYYWVSQQVYPTPYEPKKVLITLGVATMIGALGVVPLGPTPVALAVKLAAVGAFVVAVRLTGVMTGAEFAELRRFLIGMVPQGFRRATADGEAS
jgi:O-antigen/teichoic acid export membrane protein